MAFWKQKKICFQCHNWSKGEIFLQWHNAERVQIVIHTKGGEWLHWKRWAVLFCVGRQKRWKLNQPDALLYHFDGPTSKTDLNKHCLRFRKLHKGRKSRNFNFSKEWVSRAAKKCNFLASGVSKKVSSWPTN